MKTGKAGRLAVGLALAAFAAAPASAARVDSFSPTGVAKNVRQVAVHFSEPIVPLGDPRALRDPFTIECSAKGASRWADGSSWVHTFDENLPAGLRCVFTLRDDLRTLGGAPLDAPHRFEFSTGGPAVLEVEPSWGKIAEDQRFALKLDAPATRDSLEAHVVVVASGLPDPIGVRVVEGAERDALLASLDWDAADARHVVIEARQRFAPEARLALVWGPGVATVSGVASDREQRFDFEVRPAFHARVACARENAKARCVPRGRIRITFSSPVSWEAARAIRLREVAADPARARTWSAERVWSTDGDPLVDAVSFRGPFPPHAKLRAEIPPGLQDDAGRALPGDPLEVETDRLPPLAKFSARFGVIESAAPVLPVALRHVAADASLRGDLVARAASVDTADPAKLVAWLHRIARAEDGSSVWTPDASPRPLARLSSA